MKKKTAFIIIWALVTALFNVFAFLTVTEKGLLFWLLYAAVMLVLAGLLVFVLLATSRKACEARRAKAELLDAESLTLAEPAADAAAAASRSLGGKPMGLNAGSTSTEGLPKPLTRMTAEYVEFLERDQAPAEDRTAPAEETNETKD